jgi:predicted metal-dependent hydrolase
MKQDIIRLGDLAIKVTRKDIKNVHLSVHPPDGHVTLAAPNGTRLEVARAFAITKLPWIRDQQSKMREQIREEPRRFIGRESHYLWGRRYLLTLVAPKNGRKVWADHKRIFLAISKDSDTDTRAKMVHAWHKALLHETIPPLIAKWEARLGVKVHAYFLQRMKTKWGSCNHKAGNVRLNTELVKKPKDLLEYVIVHEMAHLLVPTHSDRFVAILDTHYPGWKEARAELNLLPLPCRQPTKRAA